MFYKINNLVFEGGGVLGIAYLGVLDYLYQIGILQNINRVAGTSAGAITACITCFNLPFSEIKKIADTLDYRKIPDKEGTVNLANVSASFKEEFEETFGDMDCIYRLIKDYGWYSSQYLYDWIKEQIAAQFDKNKKHPPYTFADFKNPNLHQGRRSFLDLYIIGTDISYKCSKVFSYETTPNMEVAEAVRISMSIPLFFEAIKVKDRDITKDSLLNVFSDGGVMRNYPINIFDSKNYADQILHSIYFQTLGSRFLSKITYSKINNLLDFIKNLFLSFLNVQQDIYNNSPQDIARSLQIDTKNVSPLDFNISPNDEVYNFLYEQGYKAAESYFKDNINYLK